MNRLWRRAPAQAAQAPVNGNAPGEAMAPESGAAPAGAERAADGRTAGAEPAAGQAAADLKGGAPKAEEGGAKAGLSHEPARDAEDIRLSLPEGFQADEGVTKEFRQFCADKKLSPAQAQSLVDWMAGLEERGREMSRAALQNVWGNNADVNRAKAAGVFNMLDRRSGGKLSASRAGWIMANSAECIEILYDIGQMVGEDTLGGFDVGGFEDDDEDLTLFYRKLFNKE